MSVELSSCNSSAASPTLKAKVKATVSFFVAPPCRQFQSAYWYPLSSSSSGFPMSSSERVQHPTCPIPLGLSIRSKPSIADRYLPTPELFPFPSTSSAKRNDLPTCFQRIADQARNAAKRVEGQRSFLRERQNPLYVPRTTTHVHPSLTLISPQSTNISHPQSLVAHHHRQ